MTYTNKPIPAEGRWLQCMVCRCEFHLGPDPEYDDFACPSCGSRHRRNAPEPTIEDNPFHRVLRDMADLHDRKSQDYGSDEDPYANVRASAGFGIEPWLGAILRLNDKITRIQSYTKKGYMANESLYDSLRDIAVYAVIAILLYEEAQNDDV